MVEKYKYWNDMPEVLEDNWQAYLDNFHKIISAYESGDTSTLSTWDKENIKRWLIGVDILKKISKKYDRQSYLIVSDLSDMLEKKIKYTNIGQPIIDSFFSYHLWNCNIVLNNH